MLQVPDKSLKLDQRALLYNAVLDPYVIVIKDRVVVVFIGRAFNGIYADYPRFVMELIAFKISLQKEIEIGADLKLCVKHYLIENFSSRKSRLMAEELKILKGL